MHTLQGLGLGFPASLCRDAPEQRVRVRSVPAHKSDTQNNLTSSTRSLGVTICHSPEDEEALSLADESARDSDPLGITEQHIPFDRPCTANVYDFGYEHSHWSPETTSSELDASEQQDFLNEASSSHHMAQTDSQPSPAALQSSAQNAYDFSWIVPMIEHDQVSTGASSSSEEDDDDEAIIIPYDDIEPLPTPMSQLSRQSHESLASDDCFSDAFSLHSRSEASTAGTSLHSPHSFNDLKSSPQPVSVLSRARPIPSSSHAHGAPLFASCGVSADDATRTRARSAKPYAKTSAVSLQAIVAAEASIQQTNGDATFRPKSVPAPWVTAPSTPLSEGGSLSLEALQDAVHDFEHLEEQAAGRHGNRKLLSSVRARFQRCFGAGLRKKPSSPDLRALAREDALNEVREPLTTSPLLGIQQVLSD